jgi:uncharacterized protein YkuJ
MKQTEQAQLKDIIEQLEAIQKQAPVTAVYKSGRTKASVAFQLLNIIRRLQELAGESSKAHEAIANG